jgi:hypothetical protein
LDYIIYHYIEVLGLTGDASQVDVMVQLSGTFLGSTTALAPQNGGRTVMAATKIVKKAQKIAKSAAPRTYKKFDGKQRCISARKGGVKVVVKMDLFCGWGSIHINTT